MLKKLTKVRIIGSRSIMEKAIEVLHSEKVLHIVQPTEEFESGIPLQKAEAISELLVDTRALITYLGVEEKQSNGTVYTFDEAVKSITKIKKAADLMRTQKQSDNNLNADIKAIRLRLEENGLDDEAVIAFEKIGVTDIVDHELIFNSSDASKELSKLDKLKKQYGKKLEKIETLAAFQRLDEIETKINARSEQSITDLKNLKKRYENRLIKFKGMLESELNKAEAPLQFEKLGKIFIATGYIESSRMKDLVSKLDTCSSKKIMVEEMEIEKDEKLPVILKNPPVINNFEFFLNLYSLPKNGEIDPTSLIFITFPLFFGFMLGDIGYGIVSLLLSLWMRMTVPKAKKFFNVMIISALATIVFGGVFGEIFGYELYVPLVNRNPDHDINTLMLLSIVIGLVHINFGLFIGFINKLKYGFIKAVNSKLSWILLQIGVAMITIGFGNRTEPTFNVGILVVIIAIIMLLFGEGFVAIFEIPGLFGNLLSYMRLMAIGLSSSILAIVINDISFSLFRSGTLGIIAGIFVIFIGHALNLAIGMLGSFLHSLRLHYVEYFGKFYSGGGIIFKPFGAKED